LGAVGSLGGQIAAAGVKGTVTMAGQTVKIASSTGRVTMAVNGTAKAVAAGVGSAAINGKSGKGIANAGLAKIVDSLAGYPIGTATNAARKTWVKLSKLLKLRLTLLPIALERTINFQHLHCLENSEQCK